MFFPEVNCKKCWLDALGITGNWQWSKNKGVCSDHFKDDDFTFLGGRRRLKCNIVPSLKLSEVKVDTSRVLNRTSASISETPLGETDLSILDNKETTTGRNRNQEISQNILNTSHGSDQGVKRLIKSMHSYSTSPATIKNKNTELKKKVLFYRKKVNYANKKIKSLSKEVSTLKAILECLVKERYEGATNHLKYIQDIP